ncbi:unnamed protein product, partial [Durusdinium trenchii]
VVTYGALVTAAEKGQLWQDSLDLLQHSAAKGIVPDLVLTGAVISASEKAGQWQSALGIAATMASYSLQPNEIVCNAQISACAARGRVPEALQLLADMQWRQAVRSTISFNAAAEACQKSLQWESAVEIMGMMTIDTIKPDIITMSLVSPPLELAGKAELLTSFLCSAEKLGFSKTPLDLPNELSARHMTATQLLADHDALSNRVERKFHVLEWKYLRPKLERLCFAEPSASERNSARLFDSRLNRFFSLGSHFTSIALDALFGLSELWTDTARRHSRCETGCFWSQEASAHGLVAWVQYSLRTLKHGQHTVSGGSTYGYGYADALALLPLSVQHDRSRHAERLALLSVFFWLGASGPRKGARSQHDFLRPWHFELFQLDTLPTFVP